MLSWYHICGTGDQLWPLTADVTMAITTFPAAAAADVSRMCSVWSLRLDRPIVIERILHGFYTIVMH